MDKYEILSNALKGREEEILHYQINIDNYTMAIEKAKSDYELNEFVNNLETLLSTARIEQKKATIMRDVIRKQLEG